MTKTLEISEGDVDRFEACDACGTARAYYFVELESGSNLSYCIHHFTKYQDKLWEVAVTVVDMSHLLGK